MSICLARSQYGRRESRLIGRIGEVLGFQAKAVMLPVHAAVFPCITAV